MRVEVSGYQFVFPQQCACCEASPDTVLTVSASKSSGKRVVRTKTNTWDFPYCSPCVRHFEAASAAKTMTWVVSVLSLVVGLYLSSWLGFIVGALGIGGALFMYQKLMAQAKGMRTSSCVCVGKAVAFLGWDGTRQIFYVVSPIYAREFMIANKKKLINLSAEARRLIEPSGFEDCANSVQSARRYQK